MGSRWPSVCAAALATEVELLWCSQNVSRRRRLEKANAILSHPLLSRARLSRCRTKGRIANKQLTEKSNQENGKNGTLAVG
jgi:hypothetical protein